MLLRSLPAVCDDCDLKILCQAGDVLGEILTARPLKKADLRVRHNVLYRRFAFTGQASGDPGSSWREPLGCSWGLRFPNEGFRTF
jgi:hypothetical protein